MRYVVDFTGRGWFNLDHICYMIEVTVLYMLDFNVWRYSNETTLTGESQFHISTHLGIEPGSLMTGENGWTTGLVELCMNAVRLQALHRAPPQQSTMLVVKPEGGPTASMKPGLGFPFYVKRLFTRNIVTDVTDGYYVVITVVTT